MAYERVTFWRGSSVDIPDEIITGRLLFEEDTGDVFLDYKSREDGSYNRKQLNDTRKVWRSGDTFEGPVFLCRHPEEPMEAATKQYVDDVDATLQEHLGDEVRHITANERTSWNNKVDKEEGMGLSHNDFTDELLDKLNKISEGATKTEYRNAVAEDLIATSTVIGEIIIDGKSYDIYVPQVVDIPGNAETATKLKDSTLIDGFEFDGSDTIVRITNCGNSVGDTDLSITLSDYSHVEDALFFVVFSTGFSESATPYTLHIFDSETNTEIASGSLLYNGTGLEQAASNGNAFTNGCYLLSADPDANAFHIRMTPTDTSGILSPRDREKFDSVEENANAYELPKATDSTLGGVTIGNNITVSDGRISISKENVEAALGYTPSDSDSEPELPDIFTGTSDPGLVPPNTLGVTDTAFLDNHGNWSTQTVNQFIPPRYDGESDGSHWEEGVAGLVPPPGTPSEEETELSLRFLGNDAAWHEIEIPENLGSENIERIPTSHISDILLGVYDYRVAYGNDTSQSVDPIDNIKRVDIAQDLWEIYEYLTPTGY